MSALVEIDLNQAIEIVEYSLKTIRKCTGLAAVLILSYDLEKAVSIGNQRMNRKEVMNIMKKSNTFVLNIDHEEDKVSVLSMYTAIQKDVYNILPTGIKRDMIIIS